MVPAVPFGVSLCLSLATVGSHPFWQDSALYLTAVKELGILYPPSFVVYELLCFLWTKALFFLDFTLAVHLFSSFCAALAAAFVAEATRAVLRSRGKVFQVTTEDPGPLADYGAILSGVLLAAGFTFWSTAILAKGYTFYYLILALLLWRMVRADESGRPRDFTIVAALIGLSWQAHPSAALIGAAFLYFVAVHYPALGWKGLLWRTGVAAATALGPALILLPILVSRDPWLTFGHPVGAGGYLRHVMGIRYVGEHGAFGVEPSRVLSFVRFLWEDLLGVGLLLVAFGLLRVARANRRMFVFVLAWLLPYAAVTILFKTEVQHDCWFVAARMPLFLAAGVGALHLASRAGRHGAAVMAGAGAAATLWAVIANLPDLSQRNYLLAEQYGRSIIGTVDPGAIVITSGDDSNGLSSYLQRVRGERPDVVLVTGSFLGSGIITGRYWYEDGLFSRHPDLGRPDYVTMRLRHPDLEFKQVATAAFINANAGGSRPIFSEIMVPFALLRPEILLIPAGVHWKVVPRSSPPAVDARYWSFPIEPEQIRPLYRRTRGQASRPGPAGMIYRPDAYERRLAVLILRARFRLALAQLEAKQFAAAARLCQSIIDYDDDEFESNPEIVHTLGISYYAAGVMDKAELVLRRSAEVSVRTENRATALFYLGDIARKRGNEGLARRYFDQALSVPGLDPAHVRQLQAEMKSP